MTRRNVRKQGWVFALTSPDSDVRLSLNFHRIVILYISCDTRSVGLGQYCLPKVYNGFKWIFKIKIVYNSPYSIQNYSGPTAHCFIIHLFFLCFVVCCFLFPKFTLNLQWYASKFCANHFKSTWKINVHHNEKRDFDDTIANSLLLWNS